MFIKSILLRFALGVALALLPQVSTARPTVATWDKDWNKGGDTYEFYAWIKKINQLDQLAVIKGKCWSACALKLSAHNVCIYPEATVHFHGVHFEGSFEVLPEDNAIFAGSMPKKIQEWIFENKAMDSVKVHKVLTGKLAIKLGIEDCNITFSKAYKDSLPPG